jgi:hypothetical protein
MSVMIKLDFSPLDNLKGQVGQLGKDSDVQSSDGQMGGDSPQKGAERINLELGVIHRQYKDTRSKGRLRTFQGKLYDGAERELKHIEEQIALLLKGVVDESAAKYYPDRGEYIRQVVASLQSRAAYLVTYLDERKEDRQYEAEERAAIMAEDKG